MIIRDLLVRLGLTGERGVDSGLRRINNNAQKTIGALNILGGVLAGAMGALSIANIARVGDEMQNLRSQIGNSTGDMAGAADQLDSLTKHANDGRVSVESYAGSWAKMNSGIKQFGGTAGDTTKFMDTLSAAFVSNGTATESANAALFQLSQTMQGGQVQGEEMNSLIDAQGELYQDIAKAIGGTVNNYKEMQKKGKVTSEMLLNAVNQFYDKYTARVKNMPMTIAQANTIISNRWSLFIDKLNRKTNFISKTADAFLWMADKVEHAMDIMSDAMGGTSEAIKHLIRVATPIAGVIAAVAGFKILTLLTSPITMILLLAAAIGLLYDDYKTWKEGGESLIDWQAWEGPITDTLKALDDLKKGFGDLAESALKILNIDLSTWTLKGELEDLSKNLQDLIYMGNQLGELLNGLASGDWEKIKVSASNLWNQGQDKPDALPAVTKSAKSLWLPDEPVTRRPKWWPEMLGGPGEPLEKNKKTEDGTTMPNPSWMDNFAFPKHGELIPQVSMAPASPATPPKTSVDQKFTYSPQNTFYLQPAGNSGDDFGSSIQQSMSESYQDFVQQIGNDLQYNAGAK